MVTYLTNFANSIYGALFTSQEEVMTKVDETLAALTTPKALESSRAALAHEGATTKPQIGSYTEITKRIPDDELKLIEAKMRSLRGVKEEVARLKDLLSEGKYHDLPDDAFYYALQGVKCGFCDASIAMRIGDIETLRKQGIEFTVIDIAEQDEQFFKSSLSGHITYVSDFKAFVEKAKALDAIDRFVMVYDPKPVKKVTLFTTTYIPETIGEVVDYRQGFKVFSRVEMDGKEKRLFPSLDLFNCVIKKLYGDQAVEPNPVFGLSTTEQIRTNGVTHTRDVCSPHLVPNRDGTSRLSIVKEADGFPAIEHDFKYHDMYHTFVVSANTREDRIRFVHVSDIFHRAAVALKPWIPIKDTKALESLRCHAFDMDNPTPYILAHTQASSGIPIDDEKRAAFKAHPSLLGVEGIAQLHRIMSFYSIVGNTAGSNTMPVSQTPEILARVFTAAFHAFNNIDVFHQALKALSDAETAEYSKIYEGYDEAFDTVFSPLKRSVWALDDDNLVKSAVEGGLELLKAWNHRKMYRRKKALGQTPLQRLTTSQ